MAAQPQWSSDYSGYLARATPHPDPTNYKFERRHLKLLAVINAMGNSDGFSLALFSDRVAVDELGDLFILQEVDYDGLVALAEAVNSLPDTQIRPREWGIAHDTTCWPNDIIFSPKTDATDGVEGEGPEGSKSSTEFVKTHVYGFDKEERTLNRPVEEYTELPDCLWELVGLIREAWRERGEENKSVTRVVKNLWR